MDLKTWIPLAVVDESFLNTVKIFYVMGRTALLVTEDDKVMACGTFAFESHSKKLTNCGQAAIPIEVVALRHKEVKGFACSCTLLDLASDRDIFILAYTRTGKIYHWSYRVGVLNTDNVERFHVPTLLFLPVAISEVACGPAHCLALSTNGEVYSWGDNVFGELGNGTRIPFANPVKVEGHLRGKHVVKISCGSRFSVVVLDNGQVFSWGYNRFGQLGILSDRKDILSPSQVSGIDSVIVKELVCGQFHVLAVSDSYELYVWGNNDSGQLGVGDKKVRLCPVKHPATQKVVDIAASYLASISVIMTMNNEVWMWGEFAGFNISVPLKTTYKSLVEVFAHYGSFRFTYKPIVREPQIRPLESMSDTIKRAFQDTETSDLTIRAEGKDILVHRAILRLRSEYFRLLLQDQWTETSQKVVEVHQSYDVIFSYLKFIYTEKLDDDPELALELLILADKYQDLALKEYCEKTAQNGIRTENVAILYPLALKLNAAKVQKSCVLFATKCLSEVMKTPAFSEWDKDTMKEFITACEREKLFIT